MKIIGWISPEGEIAKKPLLGKPCGEYVADAMRGAGASIIDSLEAAFDGCTVLTVREDAPGLCSETLAGLCEAASERPCVLMAQDMKTPLAAALNGEALAGLLGDGLPTVAALIDALNQKGIAPRVWYDGSSEDYFTVTDARSYAEAFKALNSRNVQRLLDEGVIILDPDRTVIESGVQIGAGTMVYAENTLCGSTVIGENAVLLPNNRMQNAVVGSGTTVESSVLLDCVVGSGTTVGPYAYLRPATKIGDKCRVGDFVEIKNSSIGDGTKVSHLTYVGDSDLGKDINLGCGVVFVNYDGKVKNRSVVEDHAFIGCNCNLVAPVHVGKNAYLAAGSTIVEDVPEDALFVARSRGVVKEDWVKRRKEAGKL